jgi:hypothetical protein
MENDMDYTNDAGVVVARPASSQTSHTHRLRGLAGTGLIAALASMLATTLAAAVAQAVGIDFEVPDGGETIPLSGFAVVTGFFSVVGVVIGPCSPGQTPPPPPPCLRCTSSQRR